MSDRTAIRSLGARRVWNSRGLPTVEVNVQLGDDGARGRGIAPAGASTGRYELGTGRDADGRLDGLDVAGALAAMDGVVAPALVGLDAEDQALVDERLLALREQNASAVGGSLLIATSLAVAQAAAAAGHQPLWRKLLGMHDADLRLPRPQIQVIGGGAHAGGRLDLQDLMVVPLGELGLEEALLRVAEVRLATGRLLEAAGLFNGYADEGGFWPMFASNDDALGWLTRGIEAAGYRPGEDLALSVDVAGGQLHDGGDYHLRTESRTLSVEAWGEQLLTWLERWPIILLEDPFEETDLAATAALGRRLPGTCRLVGDDLVATDAGRIEAAAGAVQAVLIKPDQIGTVSGAARALRTALGCGIMPIASARSGETEDTSIVDLAMGWETPMLKIGALARGERTLKWNALLRISEQLGHPALADIGA